MFGLKLSWDWKHTLILFGSAFAGGGLSALQQQRLPVTLADAKSDAAAFVCAGLIAVVALARKSFLSQTGGSQ